MFMVAAKFMETKEKERESNRIPKNVTTSLWFNVKLGMRAKIICSCK
jgi:hypothetical protein